MVPGAAERGGAGTGTGVEPTTVSTPLFLGEKPLTAN